MRGYWSTVLAAGAILAFVLLFDSPVSAATYSVTFTESGLPSGTTWSVTLATVGTVFSSTNQIVFPNVSPGTYSYSITNATTSSCSNLCTWHPVPSSGSVVVSSANVAETPVFTQRYYFTVAGGSGGSNGQGWYNAGSVATATSLGVFGRAAGTGFRLASYNVDGGTNTILSTSSLVSVPVTMNAAHTVSYNKVAQYQVTLDSGALTALVSISTPTLPNDNYWYDSGTAVNLILNGAWGRSAGTGNRLKSFTLNGGSSVPVSSTGPVAVLALSSVTSPEFVATSVTTQYQLTLDSGAAGALTSITSTPVPNDNYWYDSGTAVQYVGQGAYARTDGAGMRTTGWWFDSNAQNVISTAGVFFASVTMSAPHALHTAQVTQYEVSLGGTYYVYSITPPTVTGDNYWYDKGSSISVIMNGTFGRAGGDGERMTGFSLNGGQATPVVTVGHVMVLSLTSITTPQTLAVSSTAQYEVSLDSTSQAAVYYITPPTIAGDSYWYDSGVSVSLALNGVWGRASGSGFRLSSYSLNGGSPLAEASTANVAVLSQVYTKSPESVQATDQVQYQLVVNGGSGISFTVLPQIQGDVGWYDAGTSLQVSSAGIYARSAGVGQRAASWNLDGGPLNQAPTAGEVTTGLIVMSAPHTIDFGSVTQYELTLNQGASESLKSATNPTIPGDEYWYDSGSAVAVVLNATGPLGAGERYRMVSYSTNGAAPSTVSPLGSVTVLNVVSLSSPQSVSATLAVQFQFAVSGGNGATISATSPMGDNWFDNGTSLTVSTSYVWGTVAGQSRQSLVSFSLDGVTSGIQRESSGTFTTPQILIDRPQALQFNSVTQYYVTFAFSDSSGSSRITPSSLALDLRGVGTVTLANGSQWFDSGSSFSIAGVSWGGSDVVLPSSATYVVDAPLTVNSSTRVYSATIKVVDAFGLPVAGANAQVTFANGTTVRSQSGSDGKIFLALIPRGGFQAVVANLGLSSTLSGDASTQSQFQVQVPLSFPLVLLIVAIIVAGTAGMLLLLRHRTRKGPEESEAEPSAEPAQSGPPDYVGPV